jgi:hypothetical protein
MRSERILTCVTAAAMALTIGGCGTKQVTAEGTLPPGFVDSTGEAKSAVAAYPTGPYGVGIGSIVPNFEFVGYQNAAGGTASGMDIIQLSDFYNPHGKDKTWQPAAGEADDRNFPADSHYLLAGKAKPTVLLLDVASVWCEPCNEEAHLMLPELHTLYSPCGGEFMLDLHDSATPGDSATVKNLQNWTKEYKVDYPSVVDPEYRLDMLFEQSAFPNNTILDTTTMKVVQVIAGAEFRNYCDMDGSDCSTAKAGSACAGSSGTCTASTFWNAYESLLDTTRTGCTLGK